MIKKVVPGGDTTDLREAAEQLASAQCPVALTGAGISVESGIPDFRSPGGLWSVFAPEEYATLEVFRRDPAKAWKLYRALGKTLEGKEPNPAHVALAALEKAGRLQGIVTQNVDALHQAAGSSRVIEIHGDHQHLQCLRCDALEAVVPEHYTSEVVPRCRRCREPLKPNVVLFGEDVRDMAAIRGLLAACDVLLVIGTSAQVYPAAGLPQFVKRSGGLVYEFNVEETELTQEGFGAGLSSSEAFTARRGTTSDFFFEGPASVTVPLLARRVLAGG